MGKNIDKNISKILSHKCSLAILDVLKNFLDHPKQYATDTLNTASKRAMKKTAQATDNLTGHKIAHKITNNNSETGSNTEENSTEIPGKIYPYIP